MKPFYLFTALVAQIILIFIFEEVQLASVKVLLFTAFIATTIVGGFLVKRILNRGFDIKEMSSIFTTSIVTWSLSTIFVTYYLISHAGPFDPTFPVLTFIAIFAATLFNLFTYSPLKAYTTRSRKAIFLAGNGVLAAFFLFSLIMTIASNFGDPYEYFYDKVSFDGGNWVSQSSFTGYIAGWLMIWAFAISYGVLSYMTLKSGTKEKFDVNIPKPSPAHPNTVLWEAFENGRPYYRYEATNLLAQPGAYKNVPLFTKKLMTMKGTFLLHTEDGAIWMKKMTESLKNGIETAWAPHDDLGESFPHVYCRACYSSAKKIETKFGHTAYECKVCDRWEKLSKDVKTVIGVIGGIQETFREGDILYVPIWKDGDEKIAKVEIDELHIVDDFPDKLDWAINAYFQMYAEIPQRMGLTPKIVIKPGTPISENSYRMIRASGFPLEHIEPVLA